MKKILLIITLIILTGCYNYNEINDLAFISSVGIDYDDSNKEFMVTYEILNDNSTGENKTNKSYVISGTGKNIIDAFNNANLKVNNKPYYYHLKIIAIDENIAKSYAKDVVDTVLRNPDVKNEFFLVLVKDEKTINILNKSNDVDLDIGLKLFKMIKTNKVQSNISIDQNFEATTRFFANNLSHAMLNTFSLNEDDEIVELGLSVFKGYNYYTTLSLKESELFNLLIKNKAGICLDKYYNDKIITINLYSVKTDITIKNNIVNYDLNILAEIKVNTTDLDFKDPKLFQEISKTFEDELTKDITLFIKYLKDNDIDILEINNLYYAQNRKEENVFKLFEYKVNTNIKIDKKGLIFSFEN